MPDAPSPGTGRRSWHDEIGSYLKLAAHKAEQLLGLTELADAEAVRATTGQQLELAEEMSEILEDAANAGRTHGHHEVLQGTREAAHALVEILRDPSTPDVLRVHMAAAFLHSKLKLLTSMPLED
jgi:hypothetical protein